jgi:hypothetical protein
MGNAYSIIETVSAQGFAPAEINTDYVMLRNDGRALAVEPHAREILRLRKLDTEEREEHESLVDLYLRAMESASTPDVRAA